MIVVITYLFIILQGKQSTHLNNLTGNMSKILCILNCTPIKKYNFYKILFKVKLTDGRYFYLITKLKEMYLPNHECLNLFIRLKNR